MEDQTNSESIIKGASPLVRQIISLLLDEIDKLEKEQPLLPEIELAENFGVSRKTIRTAMKRLEDEGLIRRVKRKGTFPTKGTNCKPLFRKEVGRIALVGGYESIVKTKSYHAPIITGVFEKVFENNYQILHAGGNDKNEITDSIFRFASDTSVDGIILISLTDQQILSDLDKWKKPVCLIDHYSETSSIDCVRTDSNKGSQLAIEHLHRLGHQKIAYANTRNKDTNPARLAGFHEGLKIWNTQSKEEWIFYGTNPEKESEEIAMQFLSLPPNDRPSAILAFSDSMAEGIVKNLSKFGLNIPKDLSVIGTKGFNNPSDKRNSEITNVCFDWEKLGQTGAETLIERINNPRTKGRNILIPPLLEIKNSTTHINP